MNCPNCGAPVKNNATVCEYCNAPIPADPQERDQIIDDYIKNAEEKIKQKKGKYDLLLFAVLIISSIGMYFIYKLMVDISPLVKFIILIVVGILVFAGWGILIEKLESKAVEEYFKAELKKEIENFNSNIGIDYLQFSKKAADILPEKAYLRRFLYKK